MSCFLLLSSGLLMACAPEVSETSASSDRQTESTEDSTGESSGPATGKKGIPEAGHSGGNAGQGNIHSAAGGLQAIKPKVIRWSTASEHDSFGYDIFRGLSEDGPFEVINSEVIPGAGTTDVPNSYEFVDEAVEPDTIYWYFIESISLTGERKRITPIYPSSSNKD